MKTIDEIRGELGEIAADLDGCNGDDERLQRISHEVNGRLRQAKRDLDEIVQAFGGWEGGVPTPGADEAEKELGDLTMRVLIEVFGFKESEAAEINKP